MSAAHVMTPPRRRTRDEALWSAVELVDAWIARCRPMPRAHLPVGRATLPAPDALRRQLAMTVANHLEGTTARAAERSDLKALLYPLKRRVESTALRVTRSAQLRGFFEGATREDVLVVPRHHNHLRDLLPVARVLAARGRTCRFLAFRRDHLEQIRSAGCIAVDVGALGASAFSSHRECLAQATLAARQLAASAAPKGFTELEWRGGIEAAVQDLARHLEPAFAAASALGAALNHPFSAVLIGEPTTLEGRLAAAGAQAAGIPVACIQHGQFTPEDPFWRHLPLELICAWGSRSRDVLVKLGHRQEQLAITGAPWVDLLAQRAPGEHDRATGLVLVALSGAGHLIGKTEHAATVDTILQAAKGLPQLRFIFRLHPKDAAAPYVARRDELGLTNVEIEEPRLTGTDIFDQLARVDALVTVTSTAAIDAMLARVPVVTLTRADGQWQPDFAGVATTQVDGTEALIGALRRVLQGRGDKSDAATAYLDGYFFGARDGRAAARVADAVLRTIAAKPNTGVSSPAGATMLDTSMRNLKRFWTKSPKENVDRLLQRFRSKQQQAAPWRDGKHSKWNRLIHYLELLRQLAKKAGHPLELSNRRVLEIGAGPALGLGPFVLIEGASGFTQIEPGFQECRGDRAFRDEYLFPLYSTHARIWEDPKAIDFERFVARVNAIEAVNCTMEEYVNSGPPFDVVLSKSCLEHIADLDRAIDVCHRITAPGSVHAHYIDFSMHYDRDRVGSPFGATYVTAKTHNPEHLSRPGGIVNLLRPSEIEVMFRRRFASVTFFPLEDHRGRLELTHCHSDWAAYAEDDLTVANGVLIATR